MQVVGFDWANQLVRCENHRFLNEPGRALGVDQDVIVIVVDLLRGVIEVENMGGTWPQERQDGSPFVTQAIVIEDNIEVFVTCMGYAHSGAGTGQQLRESAV